MYLGKLERIEVEEQEETNGKALDLCLRLLGRIYTAENENIKTIQGSFKVAIGKNLLYYIKTENYEKAKEVMEKLPTFTNKEVLAMNDKLNGQE